MSKRLDKAIAEGNVTVRNKTSGEVVVFATNAQGNPTNLIIPPYADFELAPKYLPASFLKRSRNLFQLVRDGMLRVM